MFENATIENDSNTSKTNRTQDEIEDLVAELCLRTNSQDVEFCLRNYQYGKSLQQLSREFSNPFYWKLVYFSIFQTVAM